MAGGTGEQASLITKTILKHLEENKDKVISFGKLVAVVLEVTGYKSSESTRVRVIANSLIAGGLAEGRHDSTIRYKAKDSSGGFTNGIKDSNMGGETKEYEGNKGGFSDIRESAYKKENEEIKKQLETHKLAVAELGKKLQTERQAAEKIQKRLQAQLDEANKSTRIVSVQLLKGTKEVKTFEGIFHNEFERVLKLAQARMNIFIYGPTGCGKSHLCKQVADALDLPFYFVSCTAGMGEATLGEDSYQSARTTR